MYRSVVQAELAAGKLVELPLASGRLAHDLDLVYVKDSFFAGDYAALAAQLRS
ncbi:hypothetical protein [Levilactobacillus suantsaii]|uniref:hypothetical protein n=1 Tax=Levilactobacillus suantsaii TaxID=2292255 RepID=UPI001F1D8691|nr:hypothetical protein [Levilactobacillus suantsaii]